MSYRRWSCDNFHSDIYCCESDMGFEIHVAGRKRVGEWPECPPMLMHDLTERYAEFAPAYLKEWFR